MEVSLRWDRRVDTVQLVLVQSLSTDTRVSVMSSAKGVTIALGSFALCLRVMRIVQQLWLTFKYIFTGRG